MDKKKLTILHPRILFILRPGFNEELFAPLLLCTVGALWILAQTVQGLLWKYYFLTDYDCPSNWIGCHSLKVNRP